MIDENEIRTIFEFATKGHEKALQEVNELSAAISTLKKNGKDAAKLRAEEVKSIDALTNAYLNYEKTLNSASSKSERENFVKTKEALLDEQAALVKNAEAVRANAEAKKAAEKEQKKTEQAAKMYKSVLDELSKGIDNATVSTKSLKNAKKEMQSALEKTNLGTPEYTKLSQELAFVDKAIRSVTESQRQQVKSQGVAENSIEGMRLKLNATKVEWAALDRVLQKDMFDKKEKEIQSLTSEISEAEGRIGVFSRNVGNYKSTFDGLGFSMAQITREAPAFANSMSTGFMAISNNLPIFVDEINKLKKANAAMNAEGVKTPSIWSSITKAALSWNTALSLGVVLLTVYGKDLVNWIGSLFDAEDGLDRAARNAEELNNELGELSGAVAKQIIDLQVLSQKWKELGENAFAQKKFLKDNREELDKTGLAINSIDDAQRLLVDNKDEYIAYLNEKAMAEAAYNLAVRSTEEALKNQLEAEAIRTKGTRWWDYALAALNTFDHRVLLGYKSYSEVRAGLLNDRIKEAEDAGKKELENADFFLKRAQEGDKQASDQLDALGLKRLEIIKKEEEARKKAEQDRKDQAKKAITEQQKINQAYTQSHADRLKAQQDFATAEATQDDQSIEKYKKILKNKEAAFAEASKKRITLSQAELDQLELNEYLSDQAIEKIRKDAAEKIAEEQKKKAEAYIKATDEVQKAEQGLINAQKTGSKEQIKLNEQMLEIKRAELAKYNADELALTEEQQAELSLKIEEFTQKQIDDYRKFKETENALALEFDAAKTDAERAYIAKKQADLQRQIDAQVAALRKLGIEAKGIVVDLKPQADKVEETMVQSLEKSLATLEKFGGKTKNAWGKLANSLGGMMAAVFDLIKDKSEDAKGALVATSAAVAQSALGVVMDSINEQFEREKSQIDELYEYQENAAKRSYDEQSSALEQKYKRGEITEARYRLEQLKADREQAKKQKEISKQRAEAEYELSVKMFKAKQAQDIISTIIATSVASMQTLAAGAGFFSSPLAIAVAAMGAVQVAMIAAQQPPPPPKFEQGGFVRFGQIEGNSHANGGVPIRVGQKIVGEAEGDEGMLIVSKKAMRNKHMRRLIAEVKQTNEQISGKNQSNTRFEQGGELTYEDFLDKAKAGVRVTFDHGFLGIGATYRVNSEPVNDSEIDAAINKAASEKADQEWEAYLDKRVAALEKKEASLTARMDERIKGNSYFSGMGIGSVADYNSVTDSKEADLRNVESQIDDYRKLSDAKIESLKVQMQYEEKLANFEERRKEAASELSEVTLAFNEELLSELHDSGQIATSEYLSMLDQVRLGYGVKTADIIALKKKEIEAVKAMINEERNTELAAANEVAKYRTEALSQLRNEWKENYNETTRLIIDDVEAASEAVSQLTGSDLERFEQIRAISREIEEMNGRYQKNETLLTDGVVQSREERARLVEEQKQIKADLAIKEKEAEDAKKAFEDERAKNMEATLKQYEVANFDALLSQIKELGSSLQAEGSKWSLDKQLASDLDGVLKGINSTYDDQIAAQDKIIAGLDLEIKKAQLLHDQKVAQVKAEEAALKDSFDRQKSVIDAEFNRTTASLRQQATSLNSLVAQLRAAGLESGMGAYERSLESILAEIDAVSSKSKNSTPKLATGGAISLGSGAFGVTGSSHAQGGVPVMVGGSKVAEVEGAEQMYVVNKLAAFDPQMREALERISTVNERYTGVSLHSPEFTAPQSVSIDYDLLARKIGAEINSRPVRTQVVHSEIEQHDRVADLHRRMTQMN